MFRAVSWAFNYIISNLIINRSQTIKFYVCLILCFYFFLVLFFNNVSSDSTRFVLYTALFADEIRSFNCCTVKVQ